MTIAIRDQTEIDSPTLQAWLERGEAVEVIDIRPQSDYDAWHIPGSRNVDAYQAIHMNQPGPLADYEPPAGAPVVAVCFVGQTSRVAVGYLRSRGVPALSLTGGMQGWSLAWNTADVVLPNSQTRVLQIRRTGKGCLSYMVASEGEALVVDASVEPDVYLKLAGENGWRITQVVDSHIHADHLSRARPLAELTGAAYLLPRQERVAFDYQAIDPEDTITAGDARLKAIATPGHTFESMSFLLDDAALFTGDTLFLESVGRPDLKAGGTETERRAHALHRSLQVLSGLDGNLVVLPTHASKPVGFDGVPIAASLQAVREDVAALEMGENDFVAWILARLPENPPNYEFIVQMNEAGAMPPFDPAQVEAGGNQCAI